MNQQATGHDVNPLLDKFRDENALTWLEVANKLGISETYLHRVRKGGQQFSRKVVARLNGLLATPSASDVKEAPGVSYLDNQMAGHIAWLEDQLTASRANETRLLQIVETLSTLIAGPRPEQGRAQPEAPVAAPAARASGALYKSQRAKTA